MRGVDGADGTFGLERLGLLGLEDEPEQLRSRACKLASFGNVLPAVKGGDGDTVLRQDLDDLGGGVLDCVSYNFV